jgi:hypothetical protein
VLNTNSIYKYLIVLEQGNIFSFCVYWMFISVFFLIVMQYVLSFCSTAMLSLYLEILRLLLVEELYPAEMADLSYSIEAGEKGIVLKFSGYNQKLHVSLTEYSPNVGSPLTLS